MALFSPTVNDQVGSGLRHVYTAGGTAFTLMAGLALMPTEQVQPALDALHQIGDGIKQIMGGASALWAIVGPVIIGFAVKAGVMKSSFASQLASVTKQASNGDTAARNQMIAATTTIPAVEKIVAPTVSSEIPSAKVTSQ